MELHPKGGSLRLLEGGKVRTVTRSTQAEILPVVRPGVPKLNWRIALGLVCLFGTRLPAQFPRAQLGEFEVRGFDFALDGAWRRQAATVRANRQAMLRSGSMAQLNATSKPAVRGNYFVPVIPISYPDVPPPFASNQYQDLFFSPAPSGRAWSVKTYLCRGLAQQHVSLDGHVFGWSDGG